MALSQDELNHDLTMGHNTIKPTQIKMPYPDHNFGLPQDEIEECDNDDDESVEEDSVNTWGMTSAFEETFEDMYDSCREKSEFIEYLKEFIEYHEVKKPKPPKPVLNEAPTNPTSNEKHPPIW